jgi:hypothetical protein
MSDVEYKRGYADGLRDGYREGWKDREHKIGEILNSTYTTEKRKKAARKAWETKRSYNENNK